MKSNCAGCKQEINSKSRQIHCAACKATYHPICVNLATTDPAKNRDWQCPDCLGRQPKRDNTLVRVSGSPGCSAATGDSTPRATKRLAVGSPSLSPSDKAGDMAVAAELRLLRQEMSELKTSLFEGLLKCSEQIENFEHRVKNVEANIALIPVLQGTIAKLQEQIEQQSQSAMRNEIEIMGIEENPNENLIHTILVAATKIGANLDETDIDWVTRVGPKIRTNSNPQRPVNGPKFPRPVIVRLTRKVKKDELLREAKNRRHISSADLNIQGPDRKIYFNEHLTKLNRVLFRDARATAKEHGFRFCWVNNGRVHVRRAEGRPAINISSPADLDKLRAPVTD